MLLYLMLLETEEEKALFRKIYHKLRHKMYRVALFLLGSDAQAQDAVQESFLKVVKKFSKISALSEVQIPPYVVTIAENTAKDMLRKEKRHPTLPLDEEWEPSAPREAHSEDCYGRLVALVLELPEQYRDVLYLSCVEEQSRQAIADRSGLSVKQVDNLLYRGRKLLQERVLEEGYTP